MRAAKALASLCICTDSPEPSLLDYAISTKTSSSGPYLSYPVLRSYRHRCIVCLLQFILKHGIPGQNVLADKSFEKGASSGLFYTLCYSGYFFLIKKIQKNSAIN